MNNHPPHEESPDELSPRDGYAAWASCYDDDGNPVIALEEPAMVALLGDVKGCLALDLGCGTGRLTRALVEGGATVAALDQSPEMMEKARAKLPGKPVVLVRHSLPQPLPFPSAMFDLVVMGLVAEHVEALDLVLGDLRKVTRPGGRLVLSALHPDRTAGGQRARFIDPETGLRRPITTYHRSIGDYLALAEGAGWALIEEKSLIADEGLARRFPRAARYTGQPLGWVGCWSIPA